jgi:hypothetical protein
LFLLAFSLLALFAFYRLVFTPTIVPLSSPQPSGQQREQTEPRKRERKPVEQPAKKNKKQSPTQKPTKAPVETQEEEAEEFFTGKYELNLTGTAQKYQPMTAEPLSQKQLQRDLKQGFVPVVKKQPTTLTTEQRKERQELKKKAEDDAKQREVDRQARDDARKKKADDAAAGKAPQGTKEKSMEDIKKELDEKKRKAEEAANAKKQLKGKVMYRGGADQAKSWNTAQREDTDNTISDDRQTDFPPLN